MSTHLSLREAALSWLEHARTLPPVPQAITDAELAGGPEWDALEEVVASAAPREGHPDLYAKADGDWKPNYRTLLGETGLGEASRLIAQGADVPLAEVADSFVAFCTGPAPVPERWLLLNAPPAKRGSSWASTPCRPSRWRSCARRSRCQRAGHQDGVDQPGTVELFAGELSQAVEDGLGRFETGVEGVLREDLLGAVRQHLRVCPTPAELRAQGVGVPSGLVEGARGRSASQFARVVDAKPDMDEDFVEVVAAPGEHPRLPGVAHRCHRFGDEPATQFEARSRSCRMSSARARRSRLFGPSASAMPIRSSRRPISRPDRPSTVSARMSATEVTVAGGQGSNVFFAVVIAHPSRACPVQASRSG